MVYGAMMSSSYRLRIKHASQVVLICKNRERVLAGKDMQSVSVLEAAPSDGLSVVADDKGLIHAIGLDSEIDASLSNCIYAQEIDASDMCVLPGLVDAHTHPVWAGDRVHEFAMKVSRSS